MPDNFMPDVQVEIAFNAGYTTPAASRTWTDVSAYVELADRIRIGFGRQDERSTADANSLTLTLDNTDGRFTALRSASPYFPNVKIGRPIRVRVTPQGGSVVTRFTGFIDEWPVEWDGSDRYARTTIRASSRLARLGLSAQLRSMPESAIMTQRPVRYWTLGDAAGSTSAIDSSGNMGGALPVVDAGADIVFGTATGPGTDELTAMSTNAGDYLSSITTVNLPAGPRTIRIWHLVTALPPSGYDVIECGMAIQVSATGVVSGPVTSGPSINDGQGHDLALTRDGTNERLYVDGVLVSTAAAGAAGATTTVSIGASGKGSGTNAHAAVYSSALTTAQILGHAQAMTATGLTERTDQRVARILPWVGVATTEITAETGDQTMTYQRTSGQSVVDVLLDVESTEGGVLYDRTDGNVGFHNRSHRYLSAAAATLNMASQHVGTDYAPKLDRSALINDATVSNPVTGEKARSMSTASSDEYGIAGTSSTSVADTYDPLQQKAAWLVASYADPRIRVPSLTVDVLAHQGLTPSAQTLLGITIGDLLAVTNAPAQADTPSPTYFVEGYTEDIGPESYSLTFNLSPTYPTLNTLVLDSATRGLLDTNLLAL